MSLLKSVKQALSQVDDEEDSRGLSFSIDKEDLDFTLSDKQDIKITSKIEKLSDVDVKYPLIKPFAYAHVKWDEEQKEVLYRVIEPNLDDDDQRLLDMIKENLSEKIEISLSSMGGREKIIEYLEGQINDLMIELGIDMTQEQHKKILYYVYRDFVGLGKVEPFMHDPYIEDLGCLPYSEKVFARVDGEIKHVKAGKLAEKYIESDEKTTQKKVNGIELLSFDKNGDVDFKPVKKLLRRENYSNTKYKIKTAGNNTIEVSPDHPVLVMSSEGIKEKRAENISKKDYLIRVKEINIDANPNTKIDLIDELEERGLTDWRVRGAAQLIKDNQEDGQLLGVSNRKMANWKARDSMPIWAYTTLEDNREEDIRDEIEVYPGQGSYYSLNPLLEIDEELAKLIGYFLAEGFYESPGIGFAFNQRETEYHQEVKSILEDKFDARVTVRNRKNFDTTHIHCGGKIFDLLFRDILDLGNDCYDKKIPPIAYTWDENLIEKLLEGYINGEGYARISETTNKAVIPTASKDLADGVRMLFYRLGIQSAIDKRSREHANTWEIRLEAGQNLRNYIDRFDPEAETVLKERSATNSELYPYFISSKEEFQGQDRKYWNRAKRENGRLSKTVIEQSSKASAVIDSDYHPVPVVDIEEEEYSQPYYDFKMEENPNFMHGEFIFTHNCDGTGTPIFAVHSEFGSVKSDVVYNEGEDLENLVIKLAERAGRYVSYANPLLDGALPDGSRVNASLTEDVTAHGPTFSIRKFQETPFSAVDMMDLGTANAEIMAYMWILQQYQQSILICGGTSTGKCVAPDDKIHLGNGNIVEAEKLHDKVKDSGKPKKLFTMRDNLEVEPKKVNKFLKLENSDEVYRIKTTRGAEITVTPEHPFIVNRGGEVEKVRTDEITEQDFIAAPRKLEPDTQVQKIQPLNHDIEAYARGAYDLVRDIFDEKDETIEEISHGLDAAPRTVNEWQNQNAIPWITLEEFVEESSFSKKEALKRIESITSMHSSKELEIPTEVTPGLAELVGYIVSDGNIHGNYVYFHNQSEQLRNRVQSLVKMIFGIEGEIIEREDKVSKVQISSKALREFFRNVFDIPVDEPKARQISTHKKILKSPEEVTKSYLRALFDAEADVSNDQTEITFNTASEDLADEVVNLLHRHRIIGRKARKKVESKDYYRVKVSGKQQNEKFLEKIGLNHPEKEEKIRENIEATSFSGTNVNLIPCKEILAKIKEKEELTNQEIASSAGVARRTVGRVLNGERIPKRSTVTKITENLEAERASTELNRLKQLSNGVFWDRVDKIEKVSEDNAPQFVYDVTVDDTHTFTAGSLPLITHNTSFLNATVSFIPPEDKIVSIEDTRELQLPHENWIPSVTREMFGTSSQGDVDMDQLLKESFRQNPDYVVVGEVRGEEASVLFQGMSSGHPSLGTMHASSPNAVVKRLTTPPISLSPALIEAIDVMIIMTHAKGVEKSARRVKNVHELQKVIGESASARTNQAFSWTAVDDSFNRRGEPYLFDQISKDYGVSKQKLLDEMENRTQLLQWLQDRGVKDFDKVSEIVAEYYKNKEAILKMINSENEEYSLEDVIEAESKVDLSRPDRLDKAMEKEGEDDSLEAQINEIDGEAEIETKKTVEENPVRELEQKLKSEREKIEDIRDRKPEERDSDPFETSGQQDENPFEA